MDLVDEEDVVVLEVGEHRREVAWLFQHRSRRLPQVDAQFARDDVRQRRLAESRRPEQQHVIERLAPVARGLDEDAQLVADLLLPDVFVEDLRPQRTLEHLLLAAFGRGLDDAIQAVRFEHGNEGRNESK